MPSSIINALAIGLFASMAAAKCCKNGLDYCGSGLLNKGNYFGEITTALANAGLPNNPDTVENTLFRCLDCTHTPVVEFCGGPGKCLNGGSGHSDICG